MGSASTKHLAATAAAAVATAFTLYRGRARALQAAATAAAEVKRRAESEEDGVAPMDALIGNMDHLRVSTGRVPVHHAEGKALGHFITWWKVG